MPVKDELQFSRTSHLCTGWGLMNGVIVGANLSEQAERTSLFLETERRGDADRLWSCLNHGQEGGTSDICDWNDNIYLAPFFCRSCVQINQHEIEAYLLRCTYSAPLAESFKRGRLTTDK